MFEDAADIRQFLTNILVLAKKLKYSTWVYLFSLFFAALSIVFALIKILSMANLASASTCPIAVENKEVADGTGIYVDIAGAIEHPGMYSLSYPGRLASVIEKAGGFSKLADRVFVAQTLNLAKILEDGEKIYIPFAGESENQKETSNQKVSNSSLISINSASLEDLDSLPGVGEKRAEDIIDSRPYSQLRDLVDQDVLSETIFLNIEEFITL